MLYKSTLYRDKTLNISIPVKAGMPILECTEVWSVWKRHKEDDAIESWEKQPLCLRLMAVSWYKKKTMHTVLLCFCVGQVKITGVQLCLAYQ